MAATKDRPRIVIIGGGMVDELRPAVCLDIWHVKIHCVTALE